MKYFLFSTVKRGHRNDESINDDDNDEEEDNMNNRPFTLNDGDELSDDEQVDDNEPDSISNQHIRENFKVDNERGKRIHLFSYLSLYYYYYYY